MASKSSTPLVFLPLLPPPKMPHCKAHASSVAKLLSHCFILQLIHSLPIPFLSHPNSIMPIPFLPLRHTIQERTSNPYVLTEQPEHKNTLAQSLHTNIHTCTQSLSYLFSELAYPLNKTLALVGSVFHKQCLRPQLQARLSVLLDNVERRQRNRPYALGLVISRLLHHCSTLEHSIPNLLPTTLTYLLALAQSIHCQEQAVMLCLASTVYGLQHQTHPPTVPGQHRAQSTYSR